MTSTQDLNAQQQHIINLVQSLILSQSQRKLIEKYLAWDYKERITAQQAIEEKYTQQNFQLKRRESKYIIQKFNQFQRLNEIQKFLFQYFVVENLKMEQKQKIFEIYQKIDQDKNGFINVEDVYQIFRNYYPNKSQEKIDKYTQQFFNELDYDKTGSINFQEFCSAILYEELSQEQIEEACKQMFDFLDQDYSGEIDKKNLKKAIQAKNEKEFEYLNQIFKKIDSNKTGTIDYEEFRNAILKNLKN